MRIVLSAWMALALCVSGGCSKSSADLLASGDASVCAKSDVTDIVRTIIGEKATVSGAAVLSDYEEAKKQALTHIAFKFDQIISNYVDAENHRASCQARVIIKADDAEDRSATVSYMVAADLSNNEPIVSASIDAAATIAGAALRVILQPQLDEANERIAAENNARADKLEQDWASANQPLVAQWVKEVMSQKPAGRFTPHEVTEIIRFKSLNHQCAYGGDGGSLICDRDREYYKAFTAKFCQSWDRWMHCGSEKEDLENQEIFNRPDPTSEPAGDASNAMYYEGAAVPPA